MIKIMKYGQEPNSEIFARVSPTVNVEEIVADIIANVASYQFKDEEINAISAKLKAQVEKKL